MCVCVCHVPIRPSSLYKQCLGYGIRTSSNFAGSGAAGQPLQGLIIIIISISIVVIDRSSSSHTHAHTEFPNKTDIS